MTDLALIGDLVRRALVGDERAFNSALAVIRPRLYLYALRICKYNTYAEDVLQDAYIQAYMNFRALRNADAFYPWLRSIVQRIAWRQMSGASRTVSLTDDALTHASFAYEIESQFEEQLYASSLYERITNLSDTLQTTILLRYFSTKSEYTDIAELLGVPVGTVRSRLNEGKKQLQKIWAGGGGIDLPEKVRADGEAWNGYYETQWKYIYDDSGMRQEFLHHMTPGVNVRFTSGMSGQGRQVMDEAINEDLQFGSRFTPKRFFNIGNVGIIEGPNANSAEYPERCPPSTTVILRRNEDKVVEMNIHNSPCCAGAVPVSCVLCD